MRINTVFPGKFVLYTSVYKTNSTMSVRLLKPSCYILTHRMGGLCTPIQCVNSGFHSVALDG